MSFGTALVIVVAILAFAAIKIVRYGTSHDRRHSFLPDDGEKAQLTREVEELRERVRVLERIATDSNSTSAIETRQIAQEIEELRDRQG